MKDESQFQNKKVMILTAVFCCVTWGSAFACIKLTYQMLGVASEFEKILLAGLRYTLAGAGVLAFARLRMKKTLRLSRQELPFTLLISLLQTFAGYLLTYIGLGYTTAVKSGILVSTSVFMVAVLAHFMFREDRLSFKKVIGLLMGFAGVVLVNVSGIDGTIFSFSLKGEGFILASVLMGAVTVVLIRKYRARVDMVKMNGWQLFLGGIGLLIVGLIGSPQLPPFDWRVVLLLVYLAAVSGVNFTLWFTLLAHHNASLIEQYKFLVPVSGALMSVLLLGEHIGIEVLFAAVLVSTGVLLVNRQNGKRV